MASDDTIRGSMRPPAMQLVLTCVLGVLVAGGYVAHVARYWTQVNDDAFITFRYSKFVMLGRGPYFNVGEHVEGYTNFSMMALMAGALALFGDEHVLLIAKLIGLTAGVVAVVGASWLCTTWLRRIPALASHSPALGWLGGALLASNSGFALNTTTGLETTLFAAFVILGLCFAAAKPSATGMLGWSISFSLAALTRPEGAVVFAVFVFGALLSGQWRRAASRASVLRGGSVVVCAVAAQTAFRYFAYDGELVPNTYFAKSGGLFGLDPGGYLLAYISSHLGGLFTVFAFMPVIVGLVGGSSSGGRRVTLLQRETFIPATAVLLYSWFAVFLTGPDWMPGFRLLVAFAPVWSALAATGLILLASRIQARSVQFAALAGVLVVIGLLVWQAPVRESYQRHCETRARGYAEGHAVLADWLRGSARPGQTIALMDIGIVGFRCIDQRILDITGLTDRFIAKSSGPFLNKRFDPSYVFDRQPEYLIIAVGGPLAVGGDFDLSTLEPFTDIERRLVASAAFRERYVRMREPLPNATPLEHVAAVLGAERAFAHAMPNQRYLLLAYERH